MNLQTIASGLLISLLLAVVQAEDLVIDNLDAANVQVVGGWQVQRTEPQSRAVIAHADSYHALKDPGAADHIRFTFPVATAGFYLVELHVLGNYRVRDQVKEVPIALVHADGSTTTTIEPHRFSVSSWVPLGLHRFEAGRKGTLTIGNTKMTGVLAVDAVRLVPGTAPVLGLLWRKFSGTVTEGDSRKGCLEIYRSGPTNGSLPFHLKFTGTCGPEDYRLLNYDKEIMRTCFNAHEYVVVMNLEAVQDTLVEGAETLVVTLVANPAYSIVPAGNTALHHSTGSASHPSVTFTLFDDDAPKVSLERPGYLESVVFEGQEITLRLRREESQATNPLAVNLEANEDNGRLVIPQAHFAAGATETSVVVKLRTTPGLQPMKEAAVCLAPGPGYCRGGIGLAGLYLVDSDWPIVSLTAVDGQAGEPPPGKPADPGCIRVTRTPVGATDLRVCLSIDGSARLDTDYHCSGLTRGEQRTLAPFIPAGQASLDLEIIPIQDGEAEGFEDVVVSLGYQIQWHMNGSASKASVIIKDADTPTVTLSVVDAVAEETGAKPARVRVTRDGHLEKDLEVPLNLSGTVDRGERGGRGDGLAPSQVVIPAGQASVVWEFTPFDDLEPEPEKSLVLALATSQTSNQSPGAVTLKLLDDDAPVVSIRPAKALVREGKALADDAEVASSLSVVLTRKGGIGPMTVGLKASGSAVPGKDTAAVPATVVLPEGTGEVVVELAVLDDTLAEGTENLVVSLVEALDWVCDLKAASATFRIIDDDVPVVWVMPGKVPEKAPATAPSAPGKVPEKAPAKDVVPVDPEGVEPAGAIAGQPLALAIQRSGSLTSVLTVPLTWTGSADAADFSGGLPAVARIPAGQNRLLLNLMPADDVLAEGRESLVLTLGASATCQVPSTTAHPARIQARINDRDLPAPRASSRKVHNGSLQLAGRVPIGFDISGIEARLQPPGRGLQPSAELYDGNGYFLITITPDPGPRTTAKLVMRFTIGKIAGKEQEVSLATAGEAPAKDADE